MDADEDCEPPIVRLGMMMPPPPPPPPLHAAAFSSIGPLLLEGTSPKPPGCLALLAMSSSSDSSSCSDSDSTSTPSTTGVAGLACGRCRLGFDTPGAWLAHLQDRRCIGGGSSGSYGGLTEVCSAADVFPVEDYLASAAADPLAVAMETSLQHHQQPRLGQRHHQAPVGGDTAGGGSQAGGDQGFRCPLCSACFARSQNLENHIRRKHMGTESVACPDCGKCLSSNSSLKKHMRLHSGEAPFGCDFCNSAFRQKCELEKHLDSSHGDKELAATDKPHSCDLCGRAFLYLNSCSAHRKLHQRAYQCGHCGISLLSANDLRRHELSAHQPQQCWPYACHLCPDRFSRKAHLDAHLPVCQTRLMQQQQQQLQPQRLQLSLHNGHYHHHHNQHLGDDPDLLRCLLRAVDSSTANGMAGGRGDHPPDLSLLDSVLLASSAVDIDAVAFAGQHPM